MPVEMWVPIGIFVLLDIVLAAVLGGVGVERLVAGQKAAGKALASTAAYEAPFATGGQDKK